MIGANSVTERVRLAALDARLRGAIARRKIRRAAPGVFVRLLLAYKRWLRWRLRRIRRKELIDESREFMRGELNEHKELGGGDGD